MSMVDIAVAMTHLHLLVGLLPATQKFMRLICVQYSDQH